MNPFLFRPFLRDILRAEMDLIAEGVKRTSIFKRSHPRSLAEEDDPQATYLSGGGWDAPCYGYVTQGYSAEHAGVDIGTGGIKAPLLFPCDVEDVEVNSDAQAGLWVKFALPNGYLMSYSHLDKIEVGPGASYPEGAVIGYAGSSGNSIGVHVHISAFAPNGLRMNPLDVLSWTADPTQLPYTRLYTGTARASEVRSLVKELNESVLAAVEESIEEGADLASALREVMP